MRVKMFNEIVGLNWFVYFQMGRHCIFQPEWLSSSWFTADPSDSAGVDNFKEDGKDEEEMFEQIDIEKSGRSELVEKFWK